MPFPPSLYAPLYILFLSTRHIKRSLSEECRQTGTFLLGGRYVRISPQVVRDLWQSERSMCNAASAATGA